MWANKKQLAWKDDVSSGILYEKILSNSFSISGLWNLTNYPTIELNFRDFEYYENIFIICKFSANSITTQPDGTFGRLTFGWYPLVEVGYVHLPSAEHVEQRAYYPLDSITYYYDTSGYYTYYNFRTTTNTQGSSQLVTAKFRNNNLLQESVFRVVPSNGNEDSFTINGGYLKISAYGIPVSLL